MVQSKDGINSIASCHSLSHHKFRWLQYHFFSFLFALFPLLEVKKKKLHTTESSWCHESRGRMVSSSVGWQRLCAHSRLDYFTAAIQKLIGFFAICGLFFFFFSSTVFVSLKKRKLPRTYIISQCARHARWWEQLFLTNTVHLQPPTQALDKWWSYPAKNRYIAAPWIPNRLSLFSPSVLRHDACTVAARKVWCIVGKVIHWLKGISEYTGGKMKHCCRCWCRQKTLRLCSWSSETAVILWKKKKKNCQLNFYFLSLCFFCTSLPVFSSAWGATDATSRKICFKAKWQYLF